MTLKEVTVKYGFRTITVIRIHTGELSDRTFHQFNKRRLLVQKKWEEVCR